MSQQESEPRPRAEGSVAAAFPLALLESMRAHDRPGEVLEDEVLSVSLPRRLGLTGVVETQIMRYEEARRSGRAVPLAEVVSLIRLVLRRPDAEPILRETGQRVARWRFRRVPALWVRLLRHAPGGFAQRSARNAAVAALRDVRAGTHVDGMRPFTIRVAACIAADIEDSGPGCMLFTALIEELLLLYTGRPHHVRHNACASAGAAACEWRLLD
jgi:hypothetical protein